MTITVYIWDTDGFLCGRLEVDERAALPDRSTIQSPPATQGSEVACWTGTAWSILPERPAPTVPVVTTSAIDTERDRRIDAGMTFEGVLYQTRPSDRENIAGKSLEAFMAIIGGAQPGNLRWSIPDQDFAWIAQDNSLVPMDAQTVVAFGKAASDHKQKHVFAGRQLKDMQPIPADYADDRWWP